MGRVNRIALVGHCGADAWSLRRAIEQALSDVEIVEVNGDDKLVALAASDSLLLVNRVLDGRFKARGGVDLIQSLAQRPDPPVMALISNYDDAHRDAVAAGAQPGFGKSDLGSPHIMQRLRELAGADASADEPAEQRRPTR